MSGETPRSTAEILISQLSPVERRKLELEFAEMVVPQPKGEERHVSRSMNVLGNVVPLPFGVAPPAPPVRQTIYEFAAAHYSVPRVAMTFQGAQAAVVTLIRANEPRRS